MRQTKHARSVNYETRLKLPDVADRLADSGTGDALQPGHPNRRPREVLQTSPRDLESPIRRAVRVGQTGKRQPMSSLESRSLLHIAHCHSGDFSTCRCEPLVVVSHCDHVLAAKRSAKVPDKQEVQRSLGPRVGKRLTDPFGIQQFEIGRFVANGKFHPNIPSSLLTPGNLLTMLHSRLDDFEPRTAVELLCDCLRGVGVNVAVVNVQEVS